jgi:ribokinase
MAPPAVADRVAVVGHVEWVRFVRVARLPAPGEIVHARATWGAAGGGGAMAAFEMARLGAETRFYTAIGDDEVGRRTRAALEGRGLALEVAARPGTTHPEVFTYLTDDHERTITVLETPLAPAASDALDWGALAGAGAVYFCKGDAGALVAARAARVLVATARALPVLAAAKVPVDVLVGSAHDAGERYAPGDLDPEPGVVVRTAGAAGGTWVAQGGASGTYAAVTPPGPVRDAYGAGDSFAAGLTVALARGLPLADALALAARSGAAALGRAGV